MDVKNEEEKPQSLFEATDQITPIDFQKALKSYSSEDKKQVEQLAKSIDVRKIDNVMEYGANVLKVSFEQCGNYLKDERGSQADQKVIHQVIELSNKASKTYDDFNLVLKEPNFLEKLLLKISTKSRNSRTEKIQRSAITNYKLLIELKKSCESWISMLKESMGKITNSYISDSDNVILLEKYIVAGYIAKERIKQELDKLKAKYEETGLEIDSQAYNELKRGYDLFTIVLSNLEKSRAMYKLSIGQLALIEKSNYSVQSTIRTQMNNSMTLMGQQLRNAVLNAKNREVLEGQQAISRLNDELIKEVSQSVGITAEEAEKIMYSGFININAAKQAITTVINTCQSIKNIAEEMLPKMKMETEELNKLVNDLEPYVNSIKQDNNIISESFYEDDNNSSSNLKF